MSSSEDLHSFPNSPEHSEQACSSRWKNNRESNTPVKKRKYRHELSKGEKQTVFKRKFQPDWKNVEEYKGWLHEVPNDEAKFKCLLCNVILALKGGKQEIAKHANSKKHMLSGKARKMTTSVKYMFEASQKTTLIKDKIATAEIRITAFFAEHNIAISTADDLVELIKATCATPDVVKGISLARTKTTKIINNVLCKVETSQLISILKVTYFSVLVDESTDLLDKYLCILVRYICPESGHLMTKLLKMLKLDATDTTAENIHTQLKEYLIACGIPLTNIIGLASDGANIMLGKHNSFMTRLVIDTKVLIVLKCICHSAGIIASTACNVLPAAPEDLLRALSSYPMYLLVVNDLLSRPNYRIFK